MKKFVAILLSVVMLASLCSAFVVSADAVSMHVDLWNPADASVPTADNGIIYTTTNTTNGWWYQVAFAPNGANWEVVELKLCDGTAATIPENGFVWALHGDAAVKKWDYIYAMSVGQIYAITGLDLTAQTATNPTIELVGVASVPAPEVGGDNNTTEPAEETLFWLTQYNDQYPEGAGVIFTETDNAGQWWNHYYFYPVEGLEDVYEIVAIELGDGDVTPIKIAEGGFVYGVNVGNDWPALIAQYGCTGDGSTGQWFDTPDYMTKPNYAGVNSTAMWNDVADWAVGNQFVIKGLDLANKTIPTSTPDVDYWADDYVCTATYKAYNPNADDVTSDDVTSEDVTSEDVTSEDVTSEDVTSEDVTSEDVTSDDVTSDDESDIDDFMGELTADPVIKMEISADDYVAGGQIDVVITVTNLPDIGIIAAQGKVIFDTEVFTLTNATLSSGAIDCITGELGSEWIKENFSKVNSDGSILVATMGGVEYPDQVVTEDGLIEFTLTFDVAEDASGDYVFYMPHDGVFGSPSNAPKKTPGEGSYVVISEKTEDDVTSDDVTSEDVTSDDLTSDDITSDDITSDDVTSDDITSDDVTSDDITSDDVTSDDVTSDDVTSDDVTSDDVTSDDVTSDDVTSDDVTSDDVTSDDVTSDDVTSDDVTSDDVTSDDVTSDDVTSDDVTSDDVTSDDVTSDDLTSDDITSDDITSDDVTSDDITSDDVTSDDEVPSLKDLIEKAMGDLTDDPVIKMEISATADVAAGTVTVVVTAVNLPEGGIIAAQGNVYYDSENLTLTNGKLSSGAIDCITGDLGSEWIKENFSKFAKDGSITVASMGGVEYPDQVVTEDGKVEFTLVFDVADDYEGEIGFYIPHTSVFGSKAGAPRKLAGEGSYVIIDYVAEDDVTSDDVTSDDVTSDDVTSDDVTSDDVTSDDITSDDVTSDDITSDDVTSDDVTSDDVTSDDVTSDDVTSDDVTSDDVTSDDVTSDDVTSDDVTSDDVTSDDVTSDDVTSDDVTSDDVTSDDVTSDDVTSDDVTSDDVTSDDVTSDDVTSDDVTSDDVTSDDVTSDDVTSDDVTSDDVTSDDVTSDDVTSDDVTSDDETSDSTEDAGDASSMIVFAFLALIALAGSAIVIKSRK